MLQILLLVGTKLQMVITEMGVTILERGDVVKGTPVVEPGNHLFLIMLFLINFVLFLVIFPFYSLNSSFYPK